MNRLPIAAGITSLIVSSFSLGMSAWAVGCGNAAADDHRDPPVALTAMPTTAPVAPLDVVANAVAEKTSPKTGAPKATPTKADARDVKSDGASASAKELRVKRLVVARGVKNREPLDAGPTIALDGKPVYAFVELANGSAHDGEVVVTFERGPVSRGHVELSVPAGSARWRTWGMTRGIQTPGAWVAVVRTAGGDELARAPFEVGPSEAAPEAGGLPASAKAHPAAGEAAPAKAAVEAAPAATPRA